MAYGSFRQFVEALDQAGELTRITVPVDTDLVNGALHVVPGSHKWGVMKHVDTFSHLGLDPREWTFDKALPVVGKAGDSIFFHVKTIHGSPENHSDKPPKCSHCGARER